ncbi:galactose mutarotase [Maribellus luteus]|uniref:Aldose 1-epimerase n=1 Tax=Maribellus luteus TaxID=2305463 RepID=A0A399SWE7_9BACT|nr:aldose epimerase family protein [Maribellus luteus]RIJ46455.1 galactose mutarotase [Maribellus luteus]
MRFYVFILLVLIYSCQKKQAGAELISRQNFEGSINGKEVDLFTLTNQNGLVMQITNFGGRIVSLWVPDKEGNYEDIVLGYETLEGYLESNEIYFGALIGRYSNRIANGKFTLNDTTYVLAKNNDNHHLHGGKTGFNDVVWDAHQISGSELILKHLSKDGEEGYPGNLTVKVIYKLTSRNELKINYVANSDKATPINLTHHSFFNLHGAGKGTINDHILQINSTQYTPVKDGLIPTGCIESVKNTPFDFTKPTLIGEQLDRNNQQIKYGLGYDHNFVLCGSGLKQAAVIFDPVSGRKMEVITDEPGLQFYGGNFLNGKDVGKGGLPYNFRTAFCLETQHFPDSPNQEHFPTTILLKGQTYTSTCIYKFSVTDK